MSEMLLSDLFNLDDNKFEDKYQCLYPAMSQTKLSGNPICYIDLFNYIVSYLIENTCSYNLDGEFVPPNISVDFVKFLSYYCQAWHLAIRGYKLTWAEFFIDKNEELQVLDNEFIDLFQGHEGALDISMYLEKGPEHFNHQDFTYKQRYIMDHVIINYASLTIKELRKDIYNKKAIKEAWEVGRSIAGYLNPDGTIHVFRRAVTIKPSTMMLIKEECKESDTDPGKILLNLKIPSDKQLRTIKVDVTPQELCLAASNVVNIGHPGRSFIPPFDMEYPMIFKGYAGTKDIDEYKADHLEGAKLPPASEENKGWLIRIVAAGIYAGLPLDADEFILSDGTQWLRIQTVEC